MIYFVVFITSAATLAFELAGARALAPYLGTSTEVWAGVIGTVLGGLSLGYWLGGKIADRYPRIEILAMLVFGSGVCVASAWGLRDIIPAMFTYLPLGSLTYTAFAIGIVLFVPASAFFGAISPYAAKLSILSLDASARTVGKLSALGAVGSILGTIATSSWLLPNIGTSTLLLGIAVLLLVLSFVMACKELILRRIVIGVVVLGIAIGINASMASSMELVADVDTPYGRIWVREKPDAMTGISIRTISLDPYATQCASFFDPDGTVRSELVFEYTKAFDVALAVRPNAKRLLMIGGCNYSYPLHALSVLPNASMDVVEIDPGMTAVAEKYFGFTGHPRLTTFHEDARTYLNKSTESYDIIFTDAFNSSASIPHHLATQEAFEHVARLLNDDGLLIANIIGSRKGSRALFVQAEIATIASVLPAVRVFQVGKTPEEETGNIIVVASKTESTFDTTAVKTFIASANVGTNVTLVEVPLETFAGGVILTDDHAPVEALTKAIREERLRALRMH